MEAGNEAPATPKVPKDATTVVPAATAAAGVDASAILKATASKTDAITAKVEVPAALLEQVSTWQT